MENKQDEVFTVSSKCIQRLGWEVTCMTICALAGETGIRFLYWRCILKAGVRKEWLHTPVLLGIFFIMLVTIISDLRSTVHNMIGHLKM